MCHGVPGDGATVHHRDLDVGQDHYDGTRADLVFRLGLGFLAALLAGRLSRDQRGRVAQGHLEFLLRRNHSLEHYSGRQSGGFGNQRRDAIRVSADPSTGWDTVGSTLSGRFDEVVAKG